MGGVDLCSEGAPGGPSADGQRRRMAGCGAPRTSVSRSSPSIPQTSPVKRLRRYKKDLSLCVSHLYICTFSLFSQHLSVFSFSISHLAPDNLADLRLIPTCTVSEINRFHCDSKTWPPFFFHCCVLIPGRELHLCLLYLTWMIVFTPWRWRAFL